MLSFLALVSRFWREIIVVVLALALVGACRARDRAIAASAVATQRAHVADSILKTERPRLARSDTVLVRDTVRVGSLLRRVERDTLWRHDTVRIAGDTTPRLAVPLNVVVRQDSLNRACSVLASDCAAFRQHALVTINALETKLAAVQPVKSCTRGEIVAASLGAAGGLLLGQRVEIPTLRRRPSTSTPAK